MIKRYKNYLLIILFSLFFISCKGEIDISEAEYAPKIVIDAYLYPERKVENIIITRNFPLNSNIDVSKLILTSADVRITDLQDNMVYQLVFNPLKLSYENVSPGLKIGYGKSYRLEVKAVIDGKELFASSETTTPLQGLKADKKFLDSLLFPYGEIGNSPQKFELSFSPAMNNEFYSVSVKSLDASVSNYIYDNGFRKLDTNEIKRDLERLRYRSAFILNVKPGIEKVRANIEWPLLRFYGNYRAIIYAGDKNFKDYVLTHKNVQEFDGNFHEPKMNINGDGIGIFGSATTDTVFFKVLR